MPHIGCRSHKKIPVNDFMALVVVETVICLVGPTLGLFFQHNCHDTKVARSREDANESFQPERRVNSVRRSTLGINPLLCRP